STTVVVSGGRIVLQGLAPVGTAQVVVVETGTAGQRTIVPGADGSFSFPVRVFLPTSFQAVVGGVSSTRVRSSVAHLVRVRLSSGVLVASVSPSRAGARAVLQRYDRERFAWDTMARGVVDGQSRVAMGLPASSTGHFRIVVRGGAGWADGASAAVVAR